MGISENIGFKSTRGKLFGKFTGTSHSCDLQLVITEYDSRLRKYYLPYLNLQKDN